MKRIVLSTVLFIMAAGLSACGAPKESSGEEKPEEVIVGQETSENTITVISSEEVSVVPDMAEVVYSVKTQAAEAAQCRQKNAEDVTQVTELLKNLGVEEKSIQTSDYYMNPVYDYSGNRQRLAGYEAVTTLTISDLPIESLNEILSGSVQNGVNTVQSVTYKASRYDESYEKALERAVASAYKKAQVLASASGASVGKVTGIEEISGYSKARYTDYARSGMANSYAYAKQEALEDTADFMAGEIQVEARIVVEYELVN